MNRLRSLRTAFLNSNMGTTNMKCILAGFSLGITILAFPAIAQESSNKDGKTLHPTLSWQERERAFLVKSHVQLGDAVVYKILATQDDFDMLKKNKPEMSISDKMIGDVRVISERSETETSHYARTGVEVKALKPDDLRPKEGVKQTIYRRVASFPEYQAMLDRNQANLTTVKLMMDGLTVFAEKSGAEIEAERSMEPPRKALKGVSFPAFDLASTDGTNKNEKFFRSKLTLINFFFDKCAPCIEETPALNQFAKDHPEIQVLAMTFDTLAQVQKYVGEHHFAWPIVYDAGNVIGKDLEIRSFPSFILVDENGIILEVNGNDSKDGVDKGLARWIQRLQSQAEK